MATSPRDVTKTLNCWKYFISSQFFVDYKLALINYAKLNLFLSFLTHWFQSLNYYVRSNWTLAVTGEQYSAEAVIFDDFAWKYA